MMKESEVIAFHERLANRGDMKTEEADTIARLNESIEQIGDYFASQFTIPAETPHLIYRKVGKTWDIHVVEGGQMTSLRAASLARRIQAIHHLDELEEALKALHMARTIEVAEAADAARTWLERRST